MRGWDVSGRPADLEPWQELAVLGLLGWHEGERTVTLVSRGEGKAEVLYTAARYASARAKGKPLKDDPVRQRQEGEE